MLIDRPYAIESDYISGMSPISAHTMMDKQEIRARIPSIVHEDLKTVVLDAPSWLPYAAESYKISSNLKDYVITPVTIMYSDLPNRNGVGFPLDELSSWSSETGMVAYKTWQGKLVCIEHNNSNKELSKGVILASSMYHLPRFQGDIYAVSLLLGFDRTKDSMLANQILSGERAAYSMGAICHDYICNICNARYSKGGCDHVKLGQPKVNIVDGKLAYLQAHNFIGIECSSVEIPAYYQARNHSRPIVL